MNEREIFKITVRLDKDENMECKLEAHDVTPLEIICACRVIKSKLRETLETVYSEAPDEKITRLLKAIFPIDEVV